MKLFPNLDGLFGLADSKDVDIRPTLLRVLTDLYVQKPAHSREEEQHYTELALRLIDAVDAGTRRAVSLLLASYPAAPAAVVARLKHHVGEVAAPILEPARREATEAAGKGINPGNLPAARSETEDLSEVFFAASPAERRLILSNLAYVSAASPRPLPPSQAIDAVRRLEQAALERNSIQFVHHLERLLHLPREQTRRIVADQSGEPLVVAAKALAIPAEILQRILLFLNPAIGHSVRRVFDLARLYDEITPQAAQHLVAIWQRSGPSTRRPAIHQPVHWDDGAGHRRLPTPRRPADQASPRSERSGRR